MEEYIVVNKGECMKFASRKELERYLLDFPEMLSCEIFAVKRINPTIERRIAI